jgi:hypothetical protein
MWADKFEYSDDTKKSGRASGHVHAEIHGETFFVMFWARDAFADIAEFDADKQSLKLAGWPRLESEGAASMVVARDAATFMILNWAPPYPPGSLKVQGPTDAIIGAPSARSHLQSRH